jgi:hypothetical protein
MNLLTYCHSFSEIIYHTSMTDSPPVNCRGKKLGRTMQESEQASRIQKKHCNRKMKTSERQECWWFIKGTSVLITK